MEVWSLKNLRCLHLQHNQLEELCAEVALLTDLEEMVGGRDGGLWMEGVGGGRRGREDCGGWRERGRGDGGKR